MNNRIVVQSKPGVRLSTSALMRWDGWLSTSSNMGKPPLQHESYGMTKHCLTDTFTRQLNISKYCWDRALAWMTLVWVSVAMMFVLFPRRSKLRQDTHLPNVSTPVVKLVLCAAEKALQRSKNYTTHTKKKKDISETCTKVVQMNFTLREPTSSNTTPTPEL